MSALKSRIYRTSLTVIAWASVFATHPLRHLRHMSVLFAIPLILVIWVAALSHIANERFAARRAVVDDAASLSRVLEENVIRTVGEIDRALKFLRASFERDNRDGVKGANATWLKPLNDAHLISDLMLQTAVIDADGFLIATNGAQQVPTPISLADRPHFKVHADNREQDLLYISAPVLGRASGKWSVQLTRRFTNPNGEFGGVLVASLDPKQLSRLHDAIDVGLDGAVAIVGLDGIVRVGSGRNAPAMGDDLSRSSTFEPLQGWAQGSYLIPSDVPSSVVNLPPASQKQVPLRSPPTNLPDSINELPSTRVMSFRRVRDLPLVVMVSAADRQADSSYMRNRRLYLLTAVLLTMTTLLAMLFGLRHERRLQVIRHDLRRSEARASAKSRELELTFNHMNQGIMMVDGKGRIGFMNGQAARLLGLPDMFAHAHLRYADIIAYLKAGNDFSGKAGTIDAHVLSYIENSPEQTIMPVYERVRPNGTVIEVRTEALPDGGFVRTISDVTQRHRSAAQISHLARHDVLTNLANRRLFQEHLEQAMQGLADGAAFAVLSIDLDRFKPINDTLGHPIGDKLLQAVARRLCKTVRDTDVVARMGGDEFSIIQRFVSREHQAGSLARRLIGALAKPFEIDSHTIEIGASIGIVFTSEADVRCDDIVKAADLALYSAKTAGRGGYTFFEPTMHETVHKRRTLELDLRQALKASQFCLFYQPIQDFKSGTVTGFEALLRWQHPTRGLVPPNDFIPVAEEMGLIVQIGAWVLDTATLEATRWPDHIRVSVNLSAVQFRNPGLLTAVRGALARSNLPPSRLELEITESTLMVKDQSTLEQLHELRALGVHISMDDFGTGYSSLSYLLSFPFDKIKIDRAFIAQLGPVDVGPGEAGARKGSAAIIRATTDLANNLGITTTAEGIETREQFDRLKDLGCTEAQGYLLSRPRPVEDIPAMLLALAGKQLAAAVPTANAETTLGCSVAAISIKQSNFSG
jgi:diguanylate cyclase (GGDEF)-like protein